MRKEQWYLVVTYKNLNVSHNLFVGMLSNMYQNFLSNGETKEIILLGDFNINMLTVPNAITNELCDIYGLTNLINEPTCYKSCDGTLLDPIFVVNSHRFEKSINVHCGHSDCHNMVCCIIKLKMPAAKPKLVKYRSYKNFDCDAFASDISFVPFHVSQIFDDVSDQYWCASHMYVDVLNDHAPQKKRLIKTSQIPYMNSDLRNQMYQRSMARNKYIKSRNSHTWSVYVSDRNKATTMRQQSIRTYFLHKC